MSNNQSDPEIVGEDPRLDELKDRLDAAHSTEEERTCPAATGTDANYSLGNRVLAELLGGIGGGALLGWLIDRFAGTAPWGLLIVMAVGIVVAFVNIIRISNRKPDGS
ncbi:AtpZ/AtpI family protein [Tardiphaga sp.]|uniref:AtpZ/AtpI family protein n=1 Tax=Tardiphaga sp. TaxID=1926292 RepID=UPI00352B931E